MSESRIFAVVPAERARMADRVRAAGGTPIIDCTLTGAEIPNGAWVRVRSTAAAPGSGPVIAAEGPALSGRECWWETTLPCAPPPGFVGVVLRGRGSGDYAGDIDIRALVAGLPPGVRALADWPEPPGDALPDVEGVILSDVLFAVVEPPPGLRGRLERVASADIRRVDGRNFVASVAAPAYRRVAGGEVLDRVAVGYFEADDAFNHAWPGGAGLLHASSIARRYGSLEGVLMAYGAGRGVPSPSVSSSPSPSSEAVAPAVVDLGKHGPIAVIGLGCRLPRSPSAAALWENLLTGFDAITEVPHDRWDPALYWDPDHATIDKTYAKIGGFVTDFVFNPRRFRVPPSVARLIDPIQQMALEASADALDDAGYGEKRDYDRARVAVILGNSMGGEITDEYTLRVMFPAIRKALNEVPGFAALPDAARDEILRTYEESLKKDLPPITEDSMPGELANVVAGRVANALNLGGPNFTTDAACAGSMAAMQAAIKGLQDGDFDMALTGGADRSMGVATYTKFCKIGALSADGSRPFDADANGFVMGEGVGILVLKRLADAERDGDRIYAVMLGMGASSDGKGKGITAPNIDGQMRALHRAYENAGVNPAEVDLFECHGTSTVVGDKVEVTALSDLIGPGKRRSPVRIGSIKSNIGHLKSAAGAASALKAALALHHKVYPPSANYRKRRDDLPLDSVPLQVQEQAEPWASQGYPRRVGISAFGFGGTNFHLVMEEYTAGMATSLRAPPAVVPRPVPPPPAVPAERPPVAAIPIPQGVWALSADSPEELIAKCRALRNGRTTPYEPAAPLRVAAAAADSAEQEQQLEKVISALQKGKGFDLLRQRGISFEDVPCDGQLAFLFTGQGSQYIDMGLDLAAQYQVVADTFREADAVMEPLLGRPLTAFIRRDPSLSEEAQFEALRATEISQPATLTVDVALLRLLGAWGVGPDVVAGHSLGEYGAAVAAGMLTFKEALVAVSARGREMAAVKLDDFGKMAGIATSVETVMEVLAEVPGYVVAANKNCPTQTVIAGETESVEAAIELFKSRGITVYPLPVSHAFHSRIVAPASEPLRRVLQKLDIQEPKRRISTNVDSRYYPTGAGAREAAIEILAKQVASPVEWIAQVERMYADGARIFVECGPKRALAGFVVSILKHRPHRALYTNQPKRGGVLSFLDALAALFALGFPVRPQAAPTTELFFTPEARRSTTPLLSSRAAIPAGAAQAGAPAVQRDILTIVAAKTGYPVEALDLGFDLEADLGIDTVKLADIIASVREHYRLDPDPEFRMSEYRTLRALIDYAGGRIGATRPSALPERRPARDETEATLPADVAARFLTDIATKDLRGLDARAFAAAMLPSLQAFLGSAWEAFRASGGGEAVIAAPPPPPPPAIGAAPASAVGTSGFRPLRAGSIVCSGASLGLPAGDEVFAPDNVQRMLRGENRIVSVPVDQQDRFLAKGLVRLIKDPKTGEGTFLPVETREQVIRLAGRRAHFDLAADYGVDAASVRTLDITTQLAFAAGLEALRDAGIPLVRTYKKTTTGKSVATGWALPEAMRDTTGIIFASAFPGYDQLISKLHSDGDDGEGHFDRRFLFQILAMGHSQFAQFIGARGPNTAVNAACASTTQAIAVAEDWLRVGRCDRVIVLGADDVTNDVLLEWIGAGFMAAGAATTESDVAKAALPFDRRRHGMILGMGAVGLIIERGEDVAARGMAPVAELLGTRISNSAFHGTRLDAEHISTDVKKFVEQILPVAGVDAATFARKCVFLSHETYTPARGGSAAAEMASLPAAFGPASASIVIANTKGFTGHPMGAGIEDTVAVKALQYQKVPPIANLKEPDPDLGTLTLSKGGHYDIDYALRLAAGFGSQLCLAAWKRGAVGDERVVDGAAYTRWLTGCGGAGKLVEEHRQLRWVASTVVDVSPPPAIAPTTLVPPGGISAMVPPAARSSAVSKADVLATLIAVVAAKTGYGTEEIDPAYELEADLGIDTVKQAEIFSEVRTKYGLGTDNAFKLADYPTVDRLAGYLSERAGTGAGGPVETLEPERAGSTGAPSSNDVSVEAAATAGPVPQSPSPAPLSPAPPSPAAATPAPPSAAVPAVPAVPGGDVLPVLLAVVSKKTGYEIAELDVNFELEADLGIDTVKQAEIFSEVRDTFGLERDDTFKLADFPTIEKLAGYLEGRRWVAPAAAPPAVAQEIPAPTPTPTMAAPMLLPLSEPEAEPDSLSQLEEELPPRRIKVPPDPNALPANFRVRRPVRVSHVTLPISTLRGKVVWVMGAGPLAESLRAEVARAGAASEGKPDAVIDAGLPVLEGFAQARRLDGGRPRQWLTVLQAASTVREARDNGARAGLGKALGREWPECRACVVTVEAMHNLEDAARAVVDELGEADRAVEVWVAPAQREVAALATEALPTPDAWLADPLVLLTGGTRGITAQVALEIARRGPCTLILAARTPPGRHPFVEEAERTEAKRRLAETNTRVTPKMVEEALRPLRLAEEARVNVEAMRALGAVVEVRTLDLANPESVRELVESVRFAYRDIDVCIHGAGVEESRLIADKDEAAFHRVYDGKAGGGLALVEALSPACFFVSMGSIAGRFGNAGQVDYSAANEAMAQVCTFRPQALHVCWTAWADVGMAVRGGMESLLTSRGVELLPAVPGARLLCDLVAAGVVGEVVVAGRLGDFTQPSLHPLLDTIELIGDDAVARRSLSMTTDPWMGDHAIDGVPVLPGVMGIEMMVGTALAALPRGRYSGVEDVSFSAPLKLYRDAPTLIEVRARPEGEGVVRCTLTSTRKAKGGREIRTEHFEATVQLEEMPLLPALPSAFFPDERISQKEIYRRFFHGATFQVLRAAEAVAVQGLLAEAVVEHAPITEGLMTDPLVLEAAFQAAGLHRMAIEGVMALPSSIDAVELVRPVVEGEVLAVVAQNRGGVYDIDVDGSEGRVLRVRGFRMVERGPLEGDLKIPVPEGGWPSAAMANAAEARESLSSDEMAQVLSRGTPKRQADRMAGQMAARKAVEGLAEGREFAVDRAPSGEPVVEGVEGIHVSLTHMDGEALAMAVRGARAGIDFEEVSPRSPAFQQDWFTEREAAAFAGDDRAFTAAWAIKEAVLKALGTGMSITPREVEVVSLHAQDARVLLHGLAGRRHKALGGAPIRIRIGEFRGRVVATAVFAT